MALLRLAGNGPDELHTRPSTLVVEGPEREFRHAPLPSPPTQTGLIRIAFSVPPAELAGASLRLELPDASILRLPQPNRRRASAPAGRRSSPDRREVERQAARAHGPEAVLAVLAEQIARRAAEITVLREGAAENASQLRERESRVEELEAQLERLAGIEEASNEQLERLTAVEQTSNEQLTELERLRSATVAVEEELLARRAEIELLRGANDDDKFAEHERRVSELEQAAEAAESEHRRLQDELDARQGELESLRATLSERDSDALVLRARIDELETGQAEVDGDSDELGRLRELLETHEQRVDELDRYGREMERYSDDLESHLDEALQRAAQAEVAVADQRAEIDLLRQTVIDGDPAAEA